MSLTPSWLFLFSYWCYVSRIWVQPSPWPWKLQFMDCILCTLYIVCVLSYTLLIALKEAMDYPQNRKWLSIDWRCTSFKLILLYSSQDVYLLLPCLPLPPSTPPPSFTWSCNLMSVRLAPGQTWLMFDLAQTSCVMVATELEVMVILESRTSGTHCTCCFLLNIIFAYLDSLLDYWLFS